MKAVILSVQPKWCELIASGKKTIEVRKTRPKLDTPFKVYIYCTKDKHGWYDFGKKERLDGKVIGEFVCDTFAVDKTFGHDALFNAAACMSNAEVAAYCLNAEMYGWHISDLVIYARTKSLSDFKQCHRCPYGGYENCKQHEYSCSGGYNLTRPPQSWCYVEELEGGEGK